MVISTSRPSIKSVTYSMYQGVPLAWLEVVTKYGSTFGACSERLLHVTGELRCMREEFPAASVCRKGELQKIGKLKNKEIRNLMRLHTRDLGQWSKNLILASDYFNRWASLALLLEDKIFQGEMSIANELDKRVACDYLNFEMRTLDLNEGWYFYPQYSKMPSGGLFCECTKFEFPKIEGF